MVDDHNISAFCYPPEGTAPDTYHWLHRPTGAPYWMVAMWTGQGWVLMDGKTPRSPDALPWWQYHGPAELPKPRYLPPPAGAQEKTSPPSSYRGERYWDDPDYHDDDMPHERAEGY